MDFLTPFFEEKEHTGMWSATFVTLLTMVAAAIAVYYLNKFSKEKEAELQKQYEVLQENSNSQIKTNTSSNDEK